MGHKIRKWKEIHVAEMFSVACGIINANKEMMLEIWIYWEKEDMLTGVKYITRRMQRRRLLECSGRVSVWSGAMPTRSRGIKTGTKVYFKITYFEKKKWFINYTTDERKSSKLKTVKLSIMVKSGFMKPLR